LGLRTTFSSIIQVDLQMGSKRQSYSSKDCIMNDRIDVTGNSFCYSQMLRIAQDRYSI
jgi:hypothetical protein